MKVRDLLDAPVAAASLSADAWSQAGTALAETASGIGTTASFPTWTGDAAQSMRGLLTRATGQVGDIGSAATTTGQLLDAHCAVLTAVQAAVATTVRIAESAGMTVHPDGRVTSGKMSAAGVGMAVLDAVPGVGSAVDVVETALTVVLKGAMATVQTLDAALAARVTGVTGGIPGEAVDVAPVAAGPKSLQGLRAPSPAGVSDGVRIDAALDAALTPEGRAGILAALEGAAENLRARGLDPAETGVTAVLVDGAVGVVTGDIGTADKITTLVSGTGSGGLGGLRDSAALAGRITGPGQATVAWHGYPAPGTLAAAAWPGRAETGGAALRNFQQQLRERNPDARLSVVGHSYGTRVIDEAAGQEILALNADEVHLLGSPGMTAASADDLTLRALDGDAEVYVSKDPQDIIGLAADVPFLHGNDPADPDWGADVVNGKTPDERSWWDRAQDALGRLPGPAGALADRTGLAGTMGLVDTVGEVAGSLWGLTDGKVGDEHGSYRTDERVLDELRR